MKKIKITKGGLLIMAKFIFLVFFLICAFGFWAGTKLYTKATSRLISIFPAEDYNVMNSRLQDAANTILGKTTTSPDQCIFDQKCTPLYSVSGGEPVKLWRFNTIGDVNNDLAQMYKKCGIVPPPSTTCKPIDDMYYGDTYSDLPITNKVLL